MAVTIRQHEILNYLQKYKHARIGELAKKLYVSEATVRRELNEMKKLGLIDRMHGGAAYIDNSNEIAIHVRTERDTIDKRQTAEIAKNLLPKFKTVFIDNSSTALTLAKILDLRFKTVVTNGLVLAMELAKREEISVIVPGGALLYNSNAVSGAATIGFLNDIHFDLTLCSCAAIFEHGTYENSQEQATLKRTALLNSTKKILLADKTKFTKTAAYRTAKLDEYDAIFTNADGDTLQPFAAMDNIKIINKQFTKAEVKHLNKES